LHDEFISVFDVDSLISRNLISESTVIIKRYRRISSFDQPFSNTELIVILAKPRSTVHDSSAIRISDKRRCLNGKTTIYLSSTKEIIERDILNSL
jgi:hypothetical protein